MKRLILAALCTVMFPSGDTIAQCFSGGCFSTVRVSSFQSGGLRGRIRQRQFERNVSNVIRTQNALNSLAFVQSFAVPVQQIFTVPTSFVVPQVNFIAPSYVQSVPQFVPQAAPESNIPSVTNQLRQLQEMSQALKALQTQ